MGGILIASKPPPKSRKSARKPNKKRSLNEMSNGSHSVSKPKKRKISRKTTNLSMYISPAPIHWKVQSAVDCGGNNSAINDKGKYRIKIKV